MAAGKKPRTGRPKLPDEKRKDFMLRVRLSVAQQEALFRVAEEKGVSASDIVRMLLREHYGI